MEEMLKTIVKYLVDDPNAIEVTKREEGKATTLELRVAPNDMGKIIGKHGRIANAIRVIMKAAGSVQHKKVFVEIVE